jgi:hypothetical protein
VADVIAFPNPDQRRERNWRGLRPTFTEGMIQAGHASEAVSYAMGRMDGIMATVDYTIACEDTMRAFMFLAAAYAELWQLGGR